MVNNQIKNYAIIYSSKLKRPKKEDYKDPESILNVDSGITNSYILNDLNYIYDKLNQGDSALPTGLKQYLGNEPTKKIDLYNDRESIKQFISPVNVPLARWPGNGNHPLNLAQQLAVNISFLDKEGLFSINGPPGTGKSTLLRDIIANISVKRANILASFDNVDDAFTISNAFKHNGLNYKVWELNAELYGHEILITSSNNGAVENISKEIPKLNNIDPRWEVDYFSDIASFVLSEPCWGLGAASLGSKKNRITYFNKFWSHKAQMSDSSCVVGLEEHLKTNNIIPGWSEARANFLAVYDECNELIHDLQKLEVVIADLPNLKIKKINFKARKNKLETNIRILQKQIESIDQASSKLNANVIDLKWISDQQRMLQPSWFKRTWGVLFGIYHFNIWQREIHKLLKEIEISQKELDTLSDNKIKLTNQYTKENTKLKNHLKSENDLDLIIHKHISLIDKYKPQLGPCFPDDELWQLSNKELHQLLPWNYSKLHDIRGDLFIKALNLHKAFILNASGKLMNNLRAMNLLMRSGTFPSGQTHLLKSVWASFFMIVPVASSTFSSFASLCNGLEENSIGWMLIDEAGQAVPQAAVGAIWRSKRTIVIRRSNADKTC